MLARHARFSDFCFRGVNLAMAFDLSPGDLTVEQGTGKPHSQKDPFLAGVKRQQCSTAARAESVPTPLPQ
jgi:hypothetical protein